MANEITKEIELLHKCLKGNSDAFGCIVAKYQSLICAITYSAAGNAALSEDMAQEAFVNAWKNLAQLKDLSKFRVWLCSITRNVVRNHLRDKKQDSAMRGLPMDSLENMPHNGLEPIDAAISKEQEAVVWQALQQIPEDYREPLVLFYREGQSVREVAGQLALSEDAVRTRLSRARLMLKNTVEMMIENTVTRSRPGKAFTTAVMAGIAGIAVGSSSAAAAGTALIGSGTGSAVAGTGIMAGLAAKILTTAAVVAIGVGAVVNYNYVTKPEQKPDISEAVITVQTQKEAAKQGAGNKTDDSSAVAVTKVNENEHREADISKEIAAVSVSGKNAEGASKPSNEGEAKTGISGVVIDQLTSKPIKGAEIIYGPYNSSSSVFSDTNGRFEALDIQPSPRQQLHVIAKSYTTRTIVLDIVANKVYQDFKIELGPGSKVSGMVSDPNGNPVEGATVKTFHFTNHPVITGKDGKFEIDGLDPAFGQCQLEAIDPNYPAANVTFSPPAAGQTAVVDIVLNHGITVYGRVTNVKGEPMPEVAVGNTTSRCMWNCISGKTDKEGNYKLQNVPVGELVLWAITAKYAPYVNQFSLDSSEHSKLVNIQLADPCPMYCRIIDSQETPVPGVSILIFNYKGVTNLADWNSIVTSDSEGKFVIPNAPCHDKLILEAFAPFITNVMPELEAGQEQEYVIKVDRVGRIYGKVFNDKTSEPVCKFNVKMESTSKGEKRYGYSATWSRQGNEFDSLQGFFDTGIENIPMGAQFAVTVTADGFDPLTIDPITVQQITEEPNRSGFRLKPATILAGRVVDSNSVPIAGATIRWFSETDRLYSGEHWNSKDMATTNSNGEFALSGVGSGKRGFYITAQTFAPCLIANTILPKDANQLEKIVLQQGGEIFGRVVDNGKAVPDVSVRCNIFEKQLINSNMGNLVVETTTDNQGYYELLNLPRGELSISFDSRRSGQATFATKRVKLDAGESLELNFGDEPGFTVSGTVRQGKTLLKDVQVGITLPDSTTKNSTTDVQGQFVIRGIPAGTYTLHAFYMQGSSMGRSMSDTQLNDRREINVQADIKEDIVFGDGWVSGKIQSQFLQYKELNIMARRFVDKPIKNVIYGVPKNWEYAGQAKVDSEGNFKCANLRAGRYYLKLSAFDAEAISDVFELGESQHLENMTLNTGSGKLSIHVVDAETGQDIPHAGFAIKNDLDSYFYSKRLVPEGKSHGMATDEQGKAEYTNLPKGRYVVCGQAPGYLTTAKSDWLDVSDSVITPVTIALKPASIVWFELSEQIKQQITGETVYLRCRVTNLDTQESVPMVTLYGEDDEHTVWLLPKGYAIQDKSEIDLPEGRYEIKYRLYQDRKGSLSYRVSPPLLEGTANVELNKGETKLITVTP